MQMPCRVVRQKPQHAASKCAGPVLLSARWCPSRSSLNLLAGLPCDLFLPCGLQLMIHTVHQSYWTRLICHAQDRFLSCILDNALSLTQMLVLLSLYVMFSILLSVSVCATASLVCSRLVCAKINIESLLNDTLV